MIHHNHPELLPRIVAVEQTRRGARVLQKMDLKVPVVDVAQSEAKLTHEAPMIGRSIARTAQRKLDELAAQGVRSGKRLLLVGYGVVGGAAARAFREAGYEVSTWDESPAARDAARKDGMRPHATKEEALGAADIVVSATGTTALGPADLERIKDGAILMNAASGSHEIHPGEAHRDDPHFIADTRGDVYSRFRGEQIRLGHASHPSRMHIVLRTAAGRELLLLNDGYVINFDNQEHPTPARYIQLTMGLLYKGALQAVKHRGGPGLHPLAAKGQRAWVDEVKRDLAERGESLEHPSF
jgi:S-adenosylhomocysteine hydrolase